MAGAVCNALYPGPWEGRLAKFDAPRDEAADILRELRHHDFAPGFDTPVDPARAPGFSPMPPLRALFWSAVINGIVAVPIMAAMMWVASRRDRMGRFRASPAVLTLGWTATAVMGIAVVAMALAG